MLSQELCHPVAGLVKEFDSMPKAHLEIFIELYVIILIKEYNCLRLLIVLCPTCTVLGTRGSCSFVFFSVVAWEAFQVAEQWEVLNFPVKKGEKEI